MSKAKTEEGITWTTLGLYDDWKSGKLHELSVRSLQGSLPGMGGKGIVDLKMYKLGLKKHLLEVVLESLVPRTRNHLKTVVSRNLEDHAAVRKYLTPLPGEPEVDIAWRVNHPKGLEMFVDFAEGIIYHDLHETDVKTACRNRRTYEELLEMTAVKDELDDIISLCRDDFPPAAPAQIDSGLGAPSVANASSSQAYV